MSQYYEKYLKYKTKYLQLKNMMGGHQCPKSDTGFHQFVGECGNNSMLMILLFSDFGYTEDEHDPKIKHYISNIFQDNLMKHVESKKQFLLENKDAMYKFTPLNGNKQFIPINFELTPEDLEFFDNISQQTLNSIFDRLLPKLEGVEIPVGVNVPLEIYDEGTQEKIVSTASGKLERVPSICNSISSIEKISQIISYNAINDPHPYTHEKHGQTKEYIITLVNLFNYYLMDNTDYIVNITKIDNYDKLVNQMSNRNKILGIYMSINKPKINTGHAISFIKCKSKQYYYDTNYVNPNNDQTLIDYDWFNELVTIFESRPNQDYKYYFSDLYKKAISYMDTSYKDYELSNIYIVYHDNKYINDFNDSEYIRGSFIWSNTRYIDYLDNWFKKDQTSQDLIYERIIPVYLFNCNADISVFKKNLLNFFGGRSEESVFAIYLNIIVKSLINNPQIGITTSIVFIEYIKTILGRLSNFDYNEFDKLIVRTYLFKYGTSISEFKSKMNEIILYKDVDEDFVFIKYVNYILEILITNPKIDFAIFKNVVDYIKSIEDRVGDKIDFKFNLLLNYTDKKRLDLLITIKKINDINDRCEAYKILLLIGSDYGLLLKLLKAANKLSYITIATVLISIKNKGKLKNTYDEDGNTLFHVVYKNNKINNKQNLLATIPYINIFYVNGINRRNLLHELFDDKSLNMDHIDVINEIISTFINNDFDENRKNLFEAYDSENKIPFYYLCINNIDIFINLVNKIMVNDVFHSMLNNYGNVFTQNTFFTKLNFPLPAKVTNPPIKLKYEQKEMYIKNYIISLLITHNVYKNIADKYKDSDFDPSIMKILNTLDTFSAQNNDYCSNVDNMLCYNIFKNSANIDVLSKILGSTYRLYCNDDTLLHIIMRNDISMSDFTKLNVFMGSSGSYPINKNGELPINTLINTFTNKTDKQALFSTIMILLKHFDYSGYGDKLQNAHEEFNKCCGDDDDEFRAIITEINTIFTVRLSQLS